MITLKLNSYSTQEVQKLATLLSNMQPELRKCCIKFNNCRTCEYRHLCMDIAQATMYAEEYQPSR